MRSRVITCVALILCGQVFAQDKKLPVSTPQQFEIGRHTFFDFGPPFDYYELIVVRATPTGSLLERIILTPAGDTCTQPAKIETKSVSKSDSIADLLGATNPCTIRAKELRRELKRCKKCLVFSGANVRMRVQCGDQSRIIRSDILDRDMFDPTPSTPEHTSWTMELLRRLDQALGPGVLEKPIFAIPGREETPETSNSEALEGVRAGKYDVLFEGAPDKPSDLYSAAQVRPPVPSVRLLSSSPFEPEVFRLPQYPPLARMARIEGVVAFKVKIDADGNVTTFTLETGHPMLQGAVKEAVSGWKFARNASTDNVHAAIEFASNCPPQRSK